MDKIIEKLELVAEKYIKQLQEAPVKTIIKTLILVWLITKIKRLLK